MNDNKMQKQICVMIGQRLKELRKNKSMSQRKLADIVGVNVGTIVCWEKGRTSMYIDQLLILSTFFDVTADYIMCASNDKYKTRDGLEIK